MPLSPLVAVLTCSRASSAPPRDQGRTGADCIPVGQPNTNLQVGPTRGPALVGQNDQAPSCRITQGTPLLARIVTRVAAVPWQGAVCIVRRGGLDLVGPDGAVPRAQGRGHTLHVLQFELVQSVQCDEAQVTLEVPWRPLVGQFDACRERHVKTPALKTTLSCCGDCRPRRMTRPC